MVKEFHIVTVGTSILTNAQRAGVAGLSGKKKVSDEKFWRSFADKPTNIKQLVDFVAEDPKRYSAELNTFLRVVGQKDPGRIEVFLVSTRTAAGEICKIVLEDFLKTRGYNLYVGEDISGYFWEKEFFDETYAVDAFQKDIVLLLDRLLYLAKKKKNDGYKVFINPTGGLKAHVIVSALAGFLTGVDIYYMNEEFRDVVFLPRLFYIPRGREMEVLNLIKSNNGALEIEKIGEFEEELVRLNLYGLISVTTDKVILLEKGKFWLEELEDKQ